MAEYSGFFDAHLKDGEYDRTYLAKDFARYFSSFIGNGIFGARLNELMVYQQDNADMSIKISSGQAYINGYQYENDDELSLAIDVADGVLNRIDIVVLRWDNLERVIRLAVKKGSPAVNPSVPIVQRDDDLYELKLAEVYVKAGAINITQMSITDTRLDKNVCGLVTSVVNQIDTTDLGVQLRSFIETYAADYEAFIADLKSEHTAEIDNIIENFELWIQQEKEELDAIVADNQFVELTRKVGENTQSITNIFTLISTMQANVGMLESKVAEIGRTLSEGVMNATESTEFPGCFYKMVGEEVEWLNTPGQYGVEYRTSERHQGKPVYEKTLYVARMGANTALTISTKIPGKDIIFLYAYTIEIGSNFITLPLVKTNAVNTTAAVGPVGSTGILTIYVATDMTPHECFVKIKYVKS